MLNSDALTVAATPLSTVDDSSIIWVLLREPPVMPSRYSAFLDLVAMALKHLPEDQTAQKWLMHAMTLAASTVRSSHLMSKLIEAMLATAKTTISALPAANSSQEDSVLHVAIEARNVESFKALIQSGYPLTESQSSWMSADSVGGLGVHRRGAMSMACEQLLVCLANEDVDQAGQLLLIVEPLAEKAGVADGQASNCLREIFCAFYGVVGAGDSAIINALQVAINRSHPDIVSQTKAIVYRAIDSLLAGGANPCMVIDGSGQTLLHLAVRAGDWRCASSLIKYGADVEQCDNLGVTPMAIAKEALASSHSMRAILRFGELDKSFFR